MNFPRTQDPIEELRKFLVEQMSLVPEVLGGFDAILSGDELSDLTCATIKKEQGRRDKGSEKRVWNG
ncbi:MAG: hypothetical protein QXN05_03300 [Acidilobaceae archaeon]